MDLIEQKANELYGKFFRITPQPYFETPVEDGIFKGLKFNDWDKDWTTTMAKQCAIICVDEIIEENKKQANDFVDDFRFLYWKQVRERLLAKQ